MVTRVVAWAPYPAGTAAGMAAPEARAAVVARAAGAVPHLEGTAAEQAARAATAADEAADEALAAAAAETAETAEVVMKVVEAMARAA